MIEISTVGKSLGKVIEKDINQENIEKWQANLKKLILVVIKNMCCLLMIWIEEQAHKLDSF